MPWCLLICCASTVLPLIWSCCPRLRVLALLLLLLLLLLPTARCPC